ncbi:MAG: GNAT family N-acetyltransferase [Promethearchaeota archaeon]
MIEFRQAQQDDKDRILDINHLSYSLSPSELKEMGQNFSFIGEDHYVTVENEEIVAVLRSIPLIQNVRGSMKNMTGIGMVASSPETRCRGNVRKLMEDTIFENYKQGVAVSTLYPFKDSFYQQFGYINAAPHVFLEVNPAWLTPWNTLPAGYTLERTTVAKAGDIFQNLHTHTMKQFNGGTIRPPRRWREFIDGKDTPAIIAYNANHRPEGFLTYGISGYGFKLFGETNIGTFNRVGFFHSTLQGKHCLLHYLYLHSDQIHRVLMPFYPHESNMYAWMKGFTKVNIRQHLLSMVRIINVEKALSEISVGSPGEITFSVSDEMAPWNTGQYRLSTSSGKLSIEKLNDLPQNQGIIVSIGGLSSLLYGISSLEELEYFGWIHGLDSSSRAVLKSWFPQIPYCLSEFF